MSALASAMGRDAPSGRVRSGIGVVLGALVAAALLIAVPHVLTAYALVLCLWAPGLGWARRLAPGDRGDIAALTIVLSVCATCAVGTVMAISGMWSVPVGLLALVVVSVAGFVRLPVHRVSR